MGKQCHWIIYVTNVRIQGGQEGESMLRKEPKASREFLPYFEPFNLNDEFGKRKFEAHFFENKRCLQPKGHIYLH